MKPRCDRTPDALGLQAIHERQRRSRADSPSIRGALALPRPYHRASASPRSSRAPSARPRSHRAPSASPRSSRARAPSASPRSSRTSSASPCSRRAPSASPRSYRTPSASPRSSPATSASTRSSRAPVRPRVEAPGTMPSRAQSCDLTAVCEALGTWPSTGGMMMLEKARHATTTTRRPCASTPCRPRLTPSRTRHPVPPDILSTGLPASRSSSTRRTL